MGLNYHSVNTSFPVQVVDSLLSVCTVYVIVGLGRVYAALHYSALQYSAAAAASAPEDLVTVGAYQTFPSHPH